MVIAGKIFKLRETMPLKVIATKLLDYKTEESIEENSHKFTLYTEIANLDLTGNSLQGLYVKDTLMRINRRGEKVPVIRTLEAPFTFTIRGNEILLTIIGKKNWANYVANELSKIIFIAIGGIVEAKITPETLRQYHEANPEGTKVIFFDNVDIPNIDKLSLYGPDLKNTMLYSEYLTHGNIWYIVATSKKYGYIIGITRNCVVTVFSNIDEYTFFRFIEEEIFPLIEKSQPGTIKST